ncbi:hypothetical protein JK163_06280 [Levilactobacillus brevis]|uniref:hypothetical protein n=1 Tax=Levilactobacillus brevis TaxID=1580 RepID=UPI001BAE322D|nr:hypothetical protein [Levilactobacillus brevis]MBS1005909.1 hypothetical protein [Levilactobacillus brevis]MBS1012228.1 hypothetical protein [Levilactobacillus brevis]
MTKRLVLIAVGTTVLVTGGLFTNASAKTKHISKISNVRVTGSKVYGHTTKYANVKLLSTKNKSLGHSKANKKGNFIIKTKKSLKKVTFKFKASKKGYVSKITTYKAKKVIAKTKSKTLRTTQASAVSTKRRTSAQLAVSKAEQLVENTNESLKTAQSSLLKAKRLEGNYSYILSDCKKDLDFEMGAGSASGLAGAQQRYNDALAAYQQKEAEINTYEQQIADYTAQLTQAQQALSSAKANLATLS